MSSQASEKVSENEVKDALRKVHYPGAQKDVVASGIVKKVEVGHDVRVKVELPTMVVLPSVRENFEQEMHLAVEGVAGGLPVVFDTQVGVAAMPPAPDKNRMPSVKHVIAVASGKGGVGKSTVAINLALALKRWGAKVGILDADIFGPSVPHMLGAPQEPPGGTEAKKIIPGIYYDMKVISVGFFVDKKDAIVWRGPMVHRLLQQFVEDVDWGELDYLVVDMPPGTGDVQLSLSQLIPLTGAVIVTTPQEVALLDVVKAMSMFEKVEIQALGVVENMAYYICPSCGNHDEIFSRGGGRALAEQQKTLFLGEIPISSDVRTGGDTGKPIVEADPDSEHGKIFMDIAAKTAGVIAAKVLSRERRPAGLVVIR